MKKLLTTIGGLAAIGIGYWLLSPLFITERVSETIEDIMAPAPPGESAATQPSAPAAPTPEAISRGTFTGLAGHSGSGTAKLLSVNDKYYIRFEDDFRITNGPDLFVYFGKSGSYAAEARIGALKGNEGGQNYEVPAGIDPSRYDEVWVWCRAFSVPFARAELR